MAADAWRHPFIRPVLPEPAAWLPHLEAAYAERRYANGGPAARRLEAQLTETYGREAVVVASGTAGLVATLLALGVRGRVVLPSFTFAATAHAVRLAGCEPRFCEVSPDTWELDANAVARELTAGAAAVLHVRSFGLCRDLTSIEALCDGAGVPLVVDSAAALGGCDDWGRPIGSAGRAEVFSLHATKALGIGEGGVVLADPGLAAGIRRAINFGFDESGDVAGPGLNGKLSELAAAVGLAVLADAPSSLAARAAAGAAWLDALAGTPGLALPRRPGRPPWQSLPVLLGGSLDAEELVASLAGLGLQARRYYRPALHRTPAFAADVRLPVTDALAARMVCLPVYADQAPAETEEMAAIVLAALADVRRRAAA